MCLHWICVDAQLEILNNSILEVDRSLEKTIAILGVSLGMGGIAASTFSGYIEKPLINSNQSSSKIFLNPGIFAFLLSVTIALVTGLLTAKFVCYRGRK